MRWLRATFLYGVLTVALTWPFAAHLHLMDAGDSAFFAWEIGWEVHALKTDPAQLPHANIFWPMRYTLGLDEPVLGTALLGAPLALFTNDAVLLYNVVRLLTFLASALTAYALARQLGAGEWIALLAGALFAFSPIRTDQVAHLSTLGTQWWPLAVLFTVRFAKGDKTRDALLAALFFVLGFLACGYHGVIAAAVMPPVLLVLFWRQWDRWQRGAVATVLATAALLPVYLMHRWALEPEHYARGTEETVQYAASLETFLASSPWNRVWAPVTDPFRVIGPNNLFPGLVVPALVVAGAIVMVRRKEKPSREAIALAVMLVAAAVVALGPRVRAFGHDLGPAPWALLRDLFPLFRNIRVTSRAGVFIALPLVMLASMALQKLRPKPAWLALLAVAALADTVIAPIPMPKWSQHIDSRKEAPAVYRWLAQQQGRDPIVELPMLDVYGLERRPAFHESIYMVWSTLHWMPMANGYAGIEPREYVALRAASRFFPAEEFLQRLGAIGVRYVIVHRRGYGPFQWARIEAGMPAAFGSGQLRAVRVFGDDLVYELTSPAATTVTSPATNATRDGR